MKLAQLLTRNFATRPKKPHQSEGIFKKLVDNLKQGSSDQELKNSLQKFEEKLTEIKELESIRRAKEIVAQVKSQNEAVLSEVNDKLRSLKDTTGMAASKLGQGVSTAAKPIIEVGEKIREYVPDISDTELAKKVSRTVSDAERKIIENTNVYQYGGFKSKSEREVLKEKLEKRAQTSAGPISDASRENPEAGSALTTTKQSRFTQIFQNFKNNNRYLRRINEWKRSYDESNNVFIYFTREITDRVSGKFSAMFAENDTARAMREIKLRDPTFNLEAFTKTIREYIIPEILDAFLTADLVTLKQWCSEGTFNLLKANFEAQLKPGVQFSGKVLDLRNLELVMAKVLDDRPVLVYSFNTQQISVVKDGKGVVIDGDESAIDNITYVMAIARSDSPAPVTAGGWKLVEIAIRDRNGSW